jgi:hypothetical protein
MVGITRCVLPTGSAIGGSVGVISSLHYLPLAGLVSVLPVVGSLSRLYIVGDLLCSSDVPGCVWVSEFSLGPR